MSKDLMGFYQALPDWLPVCWKQKSPVWLDRPAEGDKPEE